MPSTLTVIGDRAFENCEAVIINIPESVKSIGDFAFFECNNIKDISIPANVNSIGTGAFAGCDALEGFYVDSDNEVYTALDRCLFNKKEKEFVCYPKGRNGNLINGVALGVDRNWRYEVPSGIRSIAPYAFYMIEFKGLNKDIHLLPDTIQNIGEYAFGKASFPRTIFSFPANLKTIGDYAFYKASCPNANLCFPDNLETIGNHAFEGATVGCVSFAGNALTTIGEYAFMEAELNKAELMKYQSCGKVLDHLELPASVQIIGKGAFKNSKLGYELDLSMTQVTTIETETFSGTDGGWVYLPETLKEIKERACVNAKVYLTFRYGAESSLEIIGDEAFYGSAGIWLRYSPIKKIGNRAFYGSTSSIDLGQPTLISIGKEAFKEAKNVSMLIIPSSVTEIGEDFCDKANVSLKVEKGSYAELYALENGYQIKREENTDTSWLNN